MIPLTLRAAAEAEEPFVTRLRCDSALPRCAEESMLIADDDAGSSYAGAKGLISIEGMSGEQLDGDVVLVLPGAGRVERLIRFGSAHNTLLLTERCDQLCVMCSQPPKKTHVDRFSYFEEACLLAEPGTVIGLTGGEPTLYKEELLGMIERVGSARPDLEFHVLTNAQHFTDEDVERLRQPTYRSVSWGIPLYASREALHDRIVGKAGAFERLHQSLDVLLMAGARIELRTVLLTLNIDALPDLAQYVHSRLRFIESWSLMQLENIGFAKGRWKDLFVDHAANFGPIRAAADKALLHGIPIHLFNFPRCSLPAAYRPLAPASISDWKRKYVPACAECSEQDQCCGFFEWHPEAHAQMGAHPL